MAEDEKKRVEDAHRTGNGAEGIGEVPKLEESSADEQLARFEEALKDEDRGHQPC